MAKNDRDRGLAEKPLGGPIFLLLLGVVSAYYIGVIDPFKAKPFDPNARSLPPKATATAADKSPTPPKVLVPEPVEPTEPEAPPRTPGSFSDGLVRAPRALQIESRVDPGTSVVAGDVVIWLTGAEELKSQILTVNENIERYDRRIASGVEVKATQRKLDEQLQKLDDLQLRYQSRIVTAPIDGVFMMLGSGTMREEGEPLFQILPD
jgi:hypothetical protein